MEKHLVVCSELCMMIYGFVPFHVVIFRFVILFGNEEYTFWVEKERGSECNSSNCSLFLPSFILQIAAFFSFFFGYLNLLIHSLFLEPSLLRFMLRFKFLELSNSVKCWPETARASRASLIGISLWCLRF
ncbi:hypothetical protein RIF29_06646 [Crotalaria pallida]|uniref:Uncharacterized protein n=1 Tax=Crotalaria pallida TaxID=3830 RepID=A0AAN9J4I9_CROPI